MAKNTMRTEIAKRLIELRENHPNFKTQQDVANALGIKRDTYARYETDTLIQLPLVEKLCELYNITSDYLLFGKDNNTYNLNNPLMHQPAFSANIDYNTNTDNEVFVLSEDEQKLIDAYRRLPENKKDYILSDIQKISNL